MATQILIPTPLRRFAGNLDAVEISGATVGEVLQNLVNQYGELKKHLMTEEGKLRSFVNVYKNDEDIRNLKQEATEVGDQDTLIVVPSIAGGAGPAPSATRMTLSNIEVKRYSRHLIMPEVGMQGQLKLKAAKVLCIGAGGLGSPVGMYLAAAGVGTLGLVDFDVVDYSNLQRQVIYGTEDVGRTKLEAARDRLKSINSEINVVMHQGPLSSENAMPIFKDYDIVVDGTDNFPTRYLVNDACVLLGKPNVYGSIFRFDGQVSVFDAKRGPCYRCLYPSPPPPGLVPSCAEGGVLGVLPGVVGTMQAVETIKLILGSGEPLIGRLILFDALKMSFRELKLRKAPDCPICGEKREMTELIDYQEFCGIGRGEEEEGRLESQWEIEPTELKEKLDRKEPVFILDVREPHEYEICAITGSTLIPLGELPNRVSELDSADEIVAHCRSGARSAKAVNFLREMGFKKVKNLRGGILAWAMEVEPSLPTY